MFLIEEYCSSESYHFTEQVEEGILGSTPVFTTVINFELIFYIFSYSDPVVVNSSGFSLS